MVRHPEAVLNADHIGAAAPVRHPMGKPSAKVVDASAQAVLKEAQELLTQVLSILSAPNFEEPASAAWSFRLARAHALTLVDQLARIADSQ